MDDSHKSEDILHPHDSHGHFTPKPGTPVVAASTNSNSDIDEPLVSVSINNPFKKILNWLDDIRKHQTTKFKIDLEIPLLVWIATIIIILSALGISINISQYVANSQVVSLLAKASPKSITVLFPTSVPAPVLISRIGTIKATYQLSGILPVSTHPSPAVAKAKEGRYVLLTNLDQITNLEFSPGIQVTQYLNKRVLVTGFYDAQKNTIQITKDTGLEFLP